MRRAFVLVLAALLVTLAPLAALAHSWRGEGDCDGWTLRLDGLWQNFGTVDIEVDGVSYGLETVINIPDASGDEERTFEVRWVKRNGPDTVIAKTIERDLSGCVPPTIPSTTTTTSSTSTTTSSTSTTTTSTTSSTTTSVPDTTVPDTTVPDTTVPDTTVPDTTVPDTTVPDTTVPDTTVPDTTEPTETTVTTIVIGDPDPTTPPPDTLPYTGSAGGLFGVGATGLLAGLGLLALTRKSDDA